MQPKTLALIDDDAEYSEFLTQHLQEQQGIAVSRFDDSNALLASPDAFSFDFYLVDLMLPGVNGVELIKILRRRTDAGVVVVSGRLGPEVFREVIT
ncbi:MAG TPA: response regulator, partial [Roseateles sp.]